VSAEGAVDCGEIALQMRAFGAFTAPKSHSIVLENIVLQAICSRFARPMSTTYEGLALAKRGENLGFAGARRRGHARNDALSHKRGDGT